MINRFLRWAAAPTAQYHGELFDWTTKLCVTVGSTSNGQWVSEAWYWMFYRPNKLAHRAVLDN